jgi:hypothetical protein
VIAEFLDDAKKALELALQELEGQEDQELLTYMVGADLIQLKRTIKTLEEQNG